MCRSASSNITNNKSFVLYFSKFQFCWQNNTCNVYDTLDYINLIQTHQAEPPWFGFVLFIVANDIIIKGWQTFVCDGCLGGGGLQVRMKGDHITVSLILNASVLFVMDRRRGTIKVSRAGLQQSLQASVLSRIVFPLRNSRSSHFFRSQVSVKKPKAANVSPLVCRGTCSTSPGSRCSMM